MTDTEAKALALVNEVAREMEGPMTLRPVGHVHYAALPPMDVFANALCRAIEREEATEARHAAEMRELKERFGEVAKDTVFMVETHCDGEAQDLVRNRLRPFILPAPDPLVEAIRSAMPKALVAHDTYDAIVMDVAAAVRKIGEAGE